MAYLRIFCTTTAGIGYFFGSTMNPLRKNSLFKVKAAKNPEIKPGSENYQNPHLGSRFAKYGMPQRDVILRFKSFQTSYDNRNRMPNWTLEHLNREKLGKLDNTKGCRIDVSVRVDPKVNKDFQSDKIDFAQRDIFRVTLVDFRNYAHSMRTVYDCHYRTNTAPQDSRFNIGVWNDLNSYCRFLAGGYADVYIYSGPVFEPISPIRMQYQVSAFNHLAYPTHYYKIIIGRKEKDVFHIGCYLLPNRAIDPNQELTEFRVPLSVIEEKSGFKLFKDGFKLPEILADFKDYRRRREEYMPSDPRSQYEIVEEAEDFEVEQNGYD
uniref:DNA/RNA non-specific endonuclease domain-containing protein n=1 Tax=Strigamia maritima TaxID=126957 RepID=T1IK89_STRMM